METPTDAMKVTMYEDFLHDINMYLVIGDHEKLQKLIQNADSWSYAARVGNGEYSEKEQQELINAKFWKLRDVE